VRIPIEPRIDSLNVVVAAGIALHGVRGVHGTVSRALLLPELPGS
jgi:tRNA G18 (ribose-2'-O)-methylase SpoU